MHSCCKFETTYTSILNIQLAAQTALVLTWTKAGYSLVELYFCVTGMYAFHRMNTILG
jgi:hypothetical protein